MYANNNMENAYNNIIEETRSIKRDHKEIETKDICKNLNELKKLCVEGAFLHDEYLKGIKLSSGLKNYSGLVNSKGEKLHIVSYHKESNELIKYVFKLKGDDHFEFMSRKTGTHICFYYGISLRCSWKDGEEQPYEISFGFGNNSIKITPDNGVLTIDGISLKN